MRSFVPGRELAALGRGVRPVAMLAASVADWRRRSGRSWAGAAKAPGWGRERPRRVRSSIRTREIVASPI
ncbi:MAG: hypothetical protein H0V79_07845 [Actinobacteria bacterium]|nr:hypothetical protein [Actinomycetota bacterium]